VTLSVDNDIAEGTAGHYYVNMPTSGTNTLTFSNSNITTFKVYDDGGKNSNYSNKCNGYLILTAPTGYVLQLSGSINTESTDNLTVYDGSTTSDTKLLDAVYSSTYMVEKSITATSTGNSMMLYFKSDGSDNYRGLDLTMTLVGDDTEYSITVINPETGGSVAASVGGNPATTAKVSNEVTLTATPPSGYMVSDIYVKDKNNNSVAVSGGWYSNNQATFIMPGSAVTVTPTFTSAKTAANGLYINMPKTGIKTATIPAGVQSFKVYDDGGDERNYSSNCDGTLVLTAPTGYEVQLSGSITTEKDNDKLTVYNGSTTSDTKLLDGVSSSSDDTSTAISTVTSTGHSMRLYFSSDASYEVGGLNLTVTLIPNTYTVSFNANGGEGDAMAAQNYTYDTAQNLTANTYTRTGYTFAEWATTADGEKAYDDQQSVSNLTAELNGNVELFAKWTAIEYTITYNGVNGATFETANPTTYTIESAAITLNNPTREGYTFAGWTGTGLDAATTSVTIAAGSTGARTYTATWTPIVYTITYNAGDGATFSTTNNSYTIESADITLDTPTHTGYDFGGWYDNSGLSGDAVTTIAAGSTGDVVLWAKWTAATTLALAANLAPDENYWTTFYCGDAGYTIDDGENACAYTAEYDGANSQLTLHNQGKDIPQGTAVIIVADNDEVSMTKADLSAFSGTNHLRGVDVETSTADIQTTLGSGTFYVLGMTTVGTEQHFGFHKYTGATMAARKAFVLVNGSNAALARSLTMVFGDATGITTVHGSGFTVNGSDAWYSLDGRRLQGKPTKSGMYINNGRKVAIK